jgi:prepilin-type processing-associated H-X9-DG protein
MKTQEASFFDRTVKPWRRMNAFTFNELLAVIFVVAILAALVVPALAATKGRELTASCLNNLRQLQVAYHLYAEDFNDLIPLNALSAESSNNWVSGIINNPHDCTNTALLESGLLYPYCKSLQIYKCPADTAPNPESGTPTVRSYSVNSYMNGWDVGCNHQDDWPSNAIFIVQNRLSTLTSPGPSKRIVFVHESPDTIDDGNFSSVPNPTSSSGFAQVDDWWNVPTAMHGNAGTFSYADGHAAIIQWQGTQLQAWETAKIIGNQQITIVSGNDLIDLRTVQNGIALPNGQN